MTILRVLTGALLVVLAAACSSTADRIVESTEPDQRAPTSGAPAPSDPTPRPDTEKPDAIPQTVDKSPWVTIVGGNRPPTLPEGTQGELSVIAVGEVKKGEFTASGTVPVLLRNMTPEFLIVDEVTGIARSPEGGLIGTGSDQGFEPAALRPGEIAFGYVYFSDLSGPSDADAIAVEITARGSKLEDQRFFSAVPLVISEVALGDDSIVGVLTNETDGLDASGPISVDAICIADDGTPVETAGSYADQDEILSGGTGSFTINLYGAQCPGIWIVASSGYSF